MRLPDPLKPWHAWLGWFEPELAAMLGELLLRLHPLLGAFRMRATGGALEPEGIDDLRRRGSYERLLLSEWALADVVPEEFDRRAAAGEHLFLAPKLVARQVDALTVAVFDTGPAQLGAARLVHVALWILLAQRAQAANARFAWGVLGKPGELHPADQADALRRLLNERSFTPGGEAAWRQADGQGRAPSREHCEQAWARHLDAARPSPGERWSIGSQAPGYGLGHRVDVQRADREHLAVVIAARQARRETRLILPASAPSARLLRGEFGPPATPSAQAPRSQGRLSVKHAPIVSFDGMDIAAILAGTHGANVYRLPAADGRQQRPPVTTHWNKRKWLLAATLDGRQFGGVMAAGMNLDFWQIQGFEHAPLPPELKPVPGQARFWPAYRVQEPGGSRPKMYVLAGGQLLAWQVERHQRFDRTRLQHSLVTSEALAIAGHGRDRLSYLGRHGSELRIVSAAHGPRVLASASVQGKVGAAFLAGHDAGRAWQGGACVELPVGGHGGERSSVWRVLRWDLQEGHSEHEIILPSDWKVLGLRQSAGNRLDLIALRPDRRGVVRIGNDGRSTLYESSSPISAGSVATAADAIALIDLDGSLVVLRDDGQSVLCYRSGDEPV